MEQSSCVLDYAHPSNLNIIRTHCDPFHVCVYVGDVQVGGLNSIRVLSLTFFSQRNLSFFCAATMPCLTLLTPVGFCVCVCVCLFYLARYATCVFPIVYVCSAAPSASVFVGVGCRIVNPGIIHRLSRPTPNARMCTYVEKWHTKLEFARHVKCACQCGLTCGWVGECICTVQSILKHEHITLVVVALWIAKGNELTRLCAQLLYKRAWIRMVVVGCANWVVVGFMWCSQKDFVTLKSMEGVLYVFMLGLLCFFRNHKPVSFHYIYIEKVTLDHLRTHI